VSPSEQASKSAVASFFHTLRIELGHQVPITIFSPGIAKSEMTDGKFIKPDGTVASYEEGVALRRVRFFNHILDFLT
jgi:short-subunit dehydrogenase